MSTVLLVRHADIDLPPTSADPPLNAAGKRRAKALADAVRDAGVSAIFTSTFRRTQLTVALAAAVARIQPRLVPNPAELAERATAGELGPLVLIAGHSNTVPDMIEAFGAPPPVIGETEFDNLFVVTTDDDGAAGLVHLRYG